MPSDRNKTKQNNNNNNINYVPCIYEIRKCFCTLICLHAECAFSINNFTQLTPVAKANLAKLLMGRPFLGAKYEKGILKGLVNGLLYHQIFLESQLSYVRKVIMIKEKIGDYNKFSAIVIQDK